MFKQFARYEQAFANWRLRGLKLGRACSRFWLIWSTRAGTHTRNACSDTKGVGKAGITTFLFFKTDEHKRMAFVTVQDTGSHRLERPRVLATLRACGRMSSGDVKMET